MKQLLSGTEAPDFELKSLSGQPFRLRAFRRAMDHILRRRDELWITTPGEIARYCATLPASILPKP